MCKIFHDMMIMKQRTSLYFQADWQIRKRIQTVGTDDFLFDPKPKSPRILFLFQHLLIRLKRASKLLCDSVMMVTRELKCNGILILNGTCG